MEPVAPPRISLVVPAYNEERFLPRLLDSVDAARAAYPGGPGEVEVVVADNASTDRTAELAAARGCRVARVERRAIAAARNGGAAIARGEILAFTDADGRIHRDTFAAVERAVASGRVVAGATGVTLDRWSPGIALSWALLAPAAWLSGLDTGVVFCRRADFDAVGGYDASRLYAEDVAFLLALRRHGRADGRRLTRLRGVKAITSTRKFDEHGDWHYLTRMPALAWRLLFRRSAASEFALRYWYRPRR
ncbi:MAG: glycosyltransferase [Thermoanaerobaculia bacterium]|nr:glycosyltransferase [Thermoanaerobaculia bacterium]